MKLLLLISAMFTAPLFADLIVPVQEKPFNVQLMGEAAKQVFDVFVATNKKAKKENREDGGINQTVKTKSLTVLCVTFVREEKTEVSVCYIKGKGIQSFLESERK